MTWIAGPFPRVEKFQKAGSLQWHWGVVEHANGELIEYSSQEEAENIAGRPYVDMVYDKSKMKWVYEGYSQ